MSSKSSKADPSEQYFTPDALARVMINNYCQLPPDGVVLDLGCGAGAFSRHLLRLGWMVIGVDPNAVVDTDVDEDESFCLIPEAYSPDLFESDERFDLVVANPPFSMAVEFLDYALEIAEKVVFLLRGDMLGSKGRLNKWTKEWPLESVTFLIPRVPFKRRVIPWCKESGIEWDPAMWDDWTEEEHGWTDRGSDSNDYCIFVFNKNHVGPATIDWLKWR